MVKLPRTQQFYNMFVSILGIRIKLLNFHDIFNNQKCSMVKKCGKTLLILSSVILFIAFVLHYPTLITNIIAHWPLDVNGNSIDHIVVYTHFYIKYVAVIVICILEAITDKQTTFHQKEIELDILQLKNVFTFQLKCAKKCNSEDNNWTQTLMNLSRLSKTRFFSISVVMSSCILFNSLRYSFYLHVYDDEHFYDIILGNLPNLFISLFVLHSSEIIVQHKKVFLLHNELIEVIASDIRRPLLGNIRTSNEHFRNVKKSHLNTAVHHIETLMKSHTQLKENVAKIQKIHSMQLSAVILNDFINIIFEVSMFTVHI